MEIKRGDTVVRDVYLKDNSCTVEEIMGEHTLTLNFLSRDTLDLRINDYIDFEGTRYKIRHNEKVTKRETSLGFEYNVVFYSSRYDLLDVEFFLHGEPERKKNFDYYTGTARDWLSLFVKNMNRAGSGWVAGSCIESRMITLSFKDKKVGSVLDELIKELDTEYWISGNTISIGKREYASNGLVLGQGEGMGFTELEVSAVDDTPPVTVLYPYGSDKNLGTDYGSDYLLLPGGVPSLEKNVAKYGRIEQSLQFDHIFPKGEFTVTEKINTLTLKSNIDFNLKECLIDDVEVIVTFQDGGLAGYDLSIVKESVDDKIKQFKLKENKEENALTVPGDINFSVGDKFILTGLKMPQSYIGKASQQLLEESQAWLDSKCEKRIQLKGKCDEVIFRLQNLFIACGQMVGVYSEQLGIDREIRVTRVKRFIENDNKPCYRYELTLSDFLQSNGFKDLVDNVGKVPDEIEDKVRPVREFSKRSWRDVMETLGMMFDPEGDYFTELIKPLAVHTAQLIVGTNSQQMDLIGVRFIPNADDDPNYFRNTAGRLVHFTVSETGVREWAIPASSFRLDNARAYYVYAKCPVFGGSGSILVSERQIKLEEDTGYYHFWVGVLNTPEDNVRSWDPNYGYTEIAGQTITTGVIKDKLARLVIDLINGTITGPVTFKAGSSGLDNVKEWPAAKKAIEDAQSTADDAVREIGETGKALSGFEETVNGAFKDGIIETAEAKAIEKYINTLNTEKADADAVYNKLYANAYLTGTAKTDLLNAKVTYNGAHTDLIKAVNDAIADGRTTATEKKNVDSKFTAYKNTLADYKARVEAANKAIQDALKGYTDTVKTKLESDLSIEAGRISAVSTKVDGIGNTIDTAGWINSTQGNTLFAAKSLEDGNKIISYINQTATTTTIKAERIDLIGAVTFNMFNTDVKNTINNASGNASSALSKANEALSDASSAWIKALSAETTASGASENASKAIQDAATAISNAATAITTAGSAKDAVNSLPAWSKEASIIQALTSATVIVNGYIKTSMIDTDTIYANMASIGGYTIKDNQLESSIYDSTGNYLYKFYLNSRSGEIGIEGSSIVTYKLSGGYKYGDDSACLYIRKDLVGTKLEGPRHAITVKAIHADDVNTMVELECESTYSSAVTFLHCKHGIRDIYAGTQHFSNDSSGIWRTVLRMGLMPSVTQVNTESTSGTRYNVKWDSATGLLYIE